MNNYTVIPARAGSKGIKNKNLQKVLDKPLFLRSLVHASLISSSEQIILSTDSKKIIEIASDFYKIKNFDSRQNEILAFGPIKLHFRSPNLSDDFSLITETLFDIRAKLLESNQRIGLFCLLQPTSPFRSIKELHLIKEIMRTPNNSKTSIISVTSVLDNHPARMYRLARNGTLETLRGYGKYKQSRRQDLPELFIRDGGFYLIGDELVKSKIQYSNTPKSIVRTFPYSLNIDNSVDLQIARNVERNTIEDPNEKLIW
jgi:CMP-N-acetylneuraminic acid synthetase